VLRDAVEEALLTVPGGVFFFRDFKIVKAAQHADSELIAPPLLGLSAASMSVRRHQQEGPHLKDSKTAGLPAAQNQAIADRRGAFGGLNRSTPVMRATRERRQLPARPGMAICPCPIVENAARISLWLERNS